MWNVSIYSSLSHTKPFCLLSFRCHCVHIIKIPEHVPEIFRTYCLWRSILVLDYHVLWCIFRNPRQYLVERNQCNANNYQHTISATGVFIVRQHKIHVMEQWSTRRCLTTRHMTLNFRSRHNQILLFLFSATPHDLVCFYDLVTLFDWYCT